jgi:hypothetical protein
MCLKAVLTTLSLLSQALTRLTLVQEGTKISTLLRNIWIGPKKLSSLPSSYKSKIPVILVTYPHTFAVEEAKSLVDSSDRSITGVFSQKYLNHSRYGIGSGISIVAIDLIRTYYSSLFMSVVEFTQKSALGCLY